MRQQQAERNKQTAAGEEGNHMGYAVHQVGVAVVQPPPCFFGGEHLGRGSFVLLRQAGHRAGQRLLQQSAGTAHGGPHRHRQYRLARKAGHLHLLVRRHNDAAGGGDLLRRQAVFHAVRAVGLHLQPHLHLGGGVLQRLGGQKGVGQPQRAAGDRQQLVGGGLRRGAGGTLPLPCGDDVQKFFRRVRLHQLAGQHRVHEQGGQLGQYLHMQRIGVFRRGDEEQQPHRLAAGGAGQARLHRQRRQAGGGHGVTFGVGDGDAAAHLGGGLLLPLPYRLLEGGSIGDVLGAAHQGRQLMDGSPFVGYGPVQRDAFRLEQVSDLHDTPPVQKAAPQGAGPLMQPILS